MPHTGKSRDYASTPGHPKPMMPMKGPMKMPGPMAPPKGPAKGKPTGKRH